jgi:glycerophosphoryl diester phosphodiesterase
LTKGPIVHKRLAAAFIGGAVLIAALIFVTASPLRESRLDKPLPVVSRVAHAGGGLDGVTYTNSIDALEANVDRYDFFEIDFSLTSDGRLVCIHDWAGSAARDFGKAFKPPPTLAEFEALVAQSAQFKNCTLDTLVAWMNAHPTKRIVTDVKGGNVRALALIAKQVPDLKAVIPQIYHPSEYEAVRAMGFETVIWTLYRYRGSNESVMKAAEKMDLYAVAMPTDREKSGLVAALAERLRLPSYVHTINSASELAELKQLGVAEIYTDWLADAAASESSAAVAASIDEP